MLILQQWIGGIQEQGFASVWSGKHKHHPPAGRIAG